MSHKTLWAFALTSTAAFMVTAVVTGALRLLYRVWTKRSASACDAEYSPS